MRILFSADGCTNPEEFWRSGLGETLRDMGHDVWFWDWRNEPSHWRAEPPFDVLLHVLVDQEAIEVARLVGTNMPNTRRVVVCSDDDWRINVSLSVAAEFDWVVTNDPNALALYHAAEFEHVRHIQYGHNPKIHYPRNVSPCIDVSFVGGCYTGRPNVIASLAKAGIDVHVWGAGWDAIPELRPMWGGVLSTEQMCRIQCQTRVNLGLNWCANWTGVGPFQPQVKARVFEAAALSAFTLHYRDRRLARYFEPDEMATWQEIPELIEAIRYYLAHEDERRLIADGARGRAVMEHGLDRRWRPFLQELEAEIAILPGV